MFDIAGLTVTRVDREDTRAMAELQELLVRCADYYELHERRPPTASAAAEEFDLFPPEVPRENIFVLAYAEGGRLIAEMTVVRGMPKPDEWWAALFVVDPAYRNRGLGARICEATFRWLATLGGTTMVFAVDTENPNGERFWRSLGFEETGRRDYVTPTGLTRPVIIMRRKLVV